MPKIPTVGQVVLFHRSICFVKGTHLRANCNIQLVTEQAIVDRVAFSRFVDLTLGPDADRWANDVPIAPDGIPADRTWTFRPEDL